MAGVGIPTNGPRPLATAPRSAASSARPDPRRFVRQLKAGAIALTAAGLGIAWALVTQNVVGATNAAAAAPASSPLPATRPAQIPSGDFFGPAGAQPQPFIGNGGGSVQAPIVRGRTS